MWKLYTAAVVTLLAAGSAWAEPLAEVREMLGKLQGSDAISASLEVENKVALDAYGKARTGTAQLNLQAGAQGLQMNFSTDLMQRAEREAQARTANPDLAAPTAEALRHATPNDISRLIGYAPVLLRTLEGATFKEQHGDTIDGKPAQLFVFDVPGHLSSKEKEDINHAEGLLKLWLGADGLPLASEESYKYTGCKFLIGFSGTEAINARYAVVGTRLVAKSRSDRSTFIGFGQDSDTTLSTMLSLR